METALEHLSKDELLELVSNLSQERERLSRERDSLSQERDILSQERDTLTQEREALAQERDYLKAQVEMLRRMQFGQKRERFESDSGQLSLPFEVPEQARQEQQEEIHQKIEYVRKRPNHQGRAKLPQHLPVVEIEIHPEGDLSEMVCIGKEITEELECQPARFYINRYVRYKYAAKNGEIGRAHV